MNFKDLFSFFKKDNFVYLDWDKDRLYGWENNKNALNVAVMAEGVERGCDFPAVDVVQGSDGGYEICYGRDSNSDNIRQYGGHHRALAHYIMQAPLKCRVVKNHRFGSYTEKNFLPIEDIVLSNDEDRIRLKTDLRCLPRDVAEKFCDDNGLSRTMLNFGDKK